MERKGPFLISMFKYIISVSKHGSDGCKMKSPRWSEDRQAAFFTLLCELPTQLIVRNLCGILFTILQKPPLVCISCRKEKQATFM